jgi:hypothetical protein
MKRNFQIVLSGPPGKDPFIGPQSRRTRLRMLLQGVVVTAFVIGSLLAALFIASTITIALWLAAGIALVVITAAVVFRRVIRQFARALGGSGRRDRES